MNKETLAHEFELFRDQLNSYILRMTASVHDTEDIVQETFIRSLSRIHSFRGQSTLKTWVFAIATNVTKDFLRQKKRWTENVTDICRDAALKNQKFFEEAMEIRHNSPQGNFEIREHISFCFTCVSKSLPLEQQLVLLLKEVYEFKLKEIATIIDHTEPMVKYYLHVARNRMMKIFDHRCSLIKKEGICHQCTELNGIFNPEQDTQQELVKIQMVKDANDKSKEDLLKLRTQILKELDPFKSGAAKLQLHHLEHNREVMEKFLEKK